MQNEIARSARNTIGDGLRRSARRDPEKTAIVFGERSWPYAELDDAANRAANALLEKGIKKGDRVAAYGRNSDAYVILWLACARAGLIHVPINFALGGDELHCILEQSGSRMLLHDTPLAEAAEEVRDRAGVETVGTLHGGNGFDLLSSAREGDASEPEVELGEEDVVQLLYTSGTTAAPKGAMLTHRSFMSEYASCIAALKYRPDDRAVDALPLYHSAQMHAVLKPLLLMGP